ncbi:hypothetical protein [Helicobacter cinaedi]|uniref:Uncharacterized protein n=1 Tax=Helicobacter cinaedi TaxID=213 RepID=A0A377JLC1_9HELI|nr:hypothetical protein [Helicobacter cinaedi]STP08589.1 Uncharacterised protein [Helicobacter cinaedi]
MLSLYELNTMLTNDSLANDKALKSIKKQRRIITDINLPPKS